MQTTKKSLTETFREFLDSVNKEKEELQRIAESATREAKEAIAQAFLLADMAKEAQTYAKTYKEEARKWKQMFIAYVVQDLEASSSEYIIDALDTVGCTKEDVADTCLSALFKDEE